MTPTSPTWGEVEQFLTADGWTKLPAAGRGGKRQPHIFYEKTLPGGRTLQTHVSHDRSATMGAGRFGVILREQLEVSKEAFWEAVNSGEPVDRPAQTDAVAAPEHEAWVIRVLAMDLHMSADEIAALSVEEARQRVHEHWSSSG